jgi:uncharacterized protein (TIGR02246 family)
VTVRDLYERLIRAWNDHDAQAFADLFAPDGVQIGFDGSLATGDEIGEHLAAIFADHQTAAYFAKVEDVRELGGDIALLRAKVGMVPPGRDELNPATNAHHTLLARGEAIVLFQNTPAQYHGRPELVEQHTAEIERVRAAGQAVI